MAYETTNKPKITMGVMLKSNAVADLGKSLNLTDEQLAKARSSALTLANDPKLKNCDTASIVKYCFEIARYNFTRDDCCYPVPYGNSIQTQIGYKGFREIAMRSGKYIDINAKPVYSCDEIFRDEDTGNIKVKFNKDYKAIDNATIVGFYAYAKRIDGTISNYLFMSKQELENYGKHYSKTYNSVWGDEFGFNKMACKTVIKQLCKELDQTKELTTAIRQDQSVVNVDLTQNDTYADNPHNEKAEVVLDINDDGEIGNDMPY